MQEAFCATHEVPTINVDGPQTDQQRLEVGTVLVDRYRIDGLLSQGGMGALLSATQLSDGQNIVIKVLKGQRIADINNVRRFYQEARVARSLNHPNVVRIFEFGVDEATRAPFLAMEFIPGRTLKALVLKQGPLSEARAVAVFTQIAEALVEAHQHNILHRDLKPSNIMVTDAPDGTARVKVLDFGLAKLMEPDAHTPQLTQPGKTVGTPAFMSPEQVTQKPQTFRSDLYGLGCMLHTALTGRPPFVADDLVDVMRMQIRAPCPPLPAFLSDGQPPSPEMVQLHRVLLAKRPEERPDSTREVVETFTRMHTQIGPPSKKGASVSIPKATTGPTQLWKPDDLVVPVGSEAAAPGFDADAVTASDAMTEPPHTVIDGRPYYLDDSAEEPAASDGQLTSIQPGGFDQEETAEAVSSDEPILGVSLLKPRPRPSTASPTPPPPRPVRRAKIRVKSIRPVHRGQRNAIVIVSVVAIGMALAAFLSVMLKTPDEVPLIAPEPLAAEPNSPGAISSAQPRVEPIRDMVSIHSVPSKATVLVNGRRLGQTPLSIRRPPKGQPVRLRIVKGKRSREMTVRHDSPDVKVRLP